MVSLVKINSGWLVSYFEGADKLTLEFPVIEEAADFLLSKGVDDDSIDESLILIHTEENVRRVNFNKQGKIFSTDVV